MIIQFGDVERAAAYGQARRVAKPRGAARSVGVPRRTAAGDRAHRLTRACKVDRPNAVVIVIGDVERAAAYGQARRVVKLRGITRSVGVPRRKEGAGRIDGSGKKTHLRSRGAGAYANLADEMIIIIGDIERAAGSHCRTERKSKLCRCARTVGISADDTTRGYDRADSCRGCVNGTQGLVDSVSNVERITVLGDPV